MIKQLFTKLNALADRIDLLLVGHGQYVRNDVPICNGELDEYYTNEQSISLSALHSVLEKL